MYSESLICIEQTSRRHISRVLTTVRNKIFISVIIVTNFLDLLANLVSGWVSVGVQCGSPCDVL